MGSDVTAFQKLLEGPEGFGERWEPENAIPRNDVSSDVRRMVLGLWVSFFTGISHARQNMFGIV